MYEKRIYRIFLFVYLICTSLYVDAQTKQCGVVKEYNERMQKTPLSEVEIAQLKKSANTLQKVIEELNL